MDSSFFTDERDGEVEEEERLNKGPRCLTPRQNDDKGRRQSVGAAERPGLRNRRTNCTCVFQLRNVEMTTFSPAALVKKTSVSSEGGAKLLGGSDPRGRGFRPG